MRYAAGPVIENWVAGADPIVVTLPKTTSRYMLRVREAVDATIALDAVPAQLWTLKAGEYYAEEDLCLPGTLKLQVSVAAGSTLEVWRWDA